MHRSIDARHEDHQMLVAVFEGLVSEHERLRQQPFDRADYRAHMQRLVAFREMLRRHVARYSQPR